MTDSRPLNFLMEIEGLHITQRVLETFRFAVFAFTTAGGDTPADATYHPRITQAFDSTRSVFTPGSTSGRSTVQRGTVVIDNTDTAWDRLQKYSFGGRPVTIRCGEQSGVLLADYPVTFVGTLEQPEFSAKSVSFAMRDAKAPLSQPIQTTKYAGTGGLEGGADLAAKPKPLLFGTALNFAPPCINALKEIYQLHDGVLASVAEVANKGALLLFGGTYANAAELQNDALAPAFGYYKTWFAGGCVRINTANQAQLVTMTASQGATTADRTAAELFAAIVDRMGADVLDADITLLDAKQPAECGVWIGTTETIAADIVDRIANTVGAGWGARNSDGVLRMVRVTENPAGPVTLTLTEDDAPKATPLKQESTADKERGRPAYRVAVKWGQNYTVQQGGDVVDSVDADRVAFLAQQWRTVAAGDLAVAEVFLDAVELSIDSLFVHEADAQAEANRLFVFRKVLRPRFTHTAIYTAERANLDLFDVVGLRYNRFGLRTIGLESGAPEWVLGVAPNAKQRTVAVTLWANTLTLRNMVTRDGRYMRTRDGRMMLTGGA